MKVRIKSYLRIQKIKNQMHFILNPYKEVKMVYNDLLEIILNKIVNVGEKEKIIQELYDEFQIDTRVSNLLIDTMLKLRVIEMYKDGGVSSNYSRYDRQLSYFDLSIQSTQREDLYKYQDKLSTSHVVILGVGGIGNYSSIALAGAGIGEITLFDGDKIEFSNLNRQILFDEDSIGQFKIDVAEKRLSAFNKTIRINKVYEMCYSEESLHETLYAIPKIDFILLSADKPRKIVNWVDNYCSKYKIPYMPCGYFGNYGIVGPIISSTTNTFQNVYPELETESDNGSLFGGTYHPPSMACTNGIVANICTLEIVKYLSGFEQVNLLSKRLIFDFSSYNTILTQYDEH